MSGEDMMEQYPLMDEEKRAMGEEFNNSTEADEVDLRELSYKTGGTACCCCICYCSNSKTRDLSCLGCLPIKCGIYTIGLMTIWTTFGDFCGFISKSVIYNQWWYGTILSLLMVPMILSSVYFLKFLRNDNFETRGNLEQACNFVLISELLIMIWNIIYFATIYVPVDSEFDLDASSSSNKKIS